MIGIDIIENSRMELKTGERILTKYEIKEYKSLKNHNQKIEYLCEMWSSKEAIIKLTDKQILFSEIEILHHESGKPFVVFYNQKNGQRYAMKNLEISISHENKFTIAIAIINKKRTNSKIKFKTKNIIRK